MLSERKVLLMRDPRAVALAIAHSVIAERRRIQKEQAAQLAARGVSPASNSSRQRMDRWTPPDVRAAGSDEEVRARRSEVLAWVSSPAHE